MPFCANWERGPRCEACYICRMVEVFEAVKRVLRDDGTLWLNVGDTMASSTKGSGGAGKSTLGPNRDLQNIQFQKFSPRQCAMPVPAKNLLGLPWRLALALQAAGWWLRSELIWHKLNPLPESVTDRPTKAHEQVFLLSKGPRYFYDAAVVKERGSDQTAGNQTHKYTSPDPQHRTKQGLVALAGVPWSTRNLRSVLSLASEPVKFAHFATFPTKLVEPCILAGSSAYGVCSACGAPYRRVVEVTRTAHPHAPGPNGRQNVPGSETSATSCFRTGLVPHATTTGWTATCPCGAGTIPATILDPFCGSGTTMLVALQHGRASIGIDLNTRYLDLAVQRLTPALAQLPLFGLPGALT
jgi:DNA modification methylase